MFEVFFAAIPVGLMMVLRAVLLLVLAFVLATVAKSLITKLIMRMNMGALSQQPDAAANRAKTADFVGKLVYLLVFLVFVPGIFESLGLSQISTPITSLLNTVWGYVPNLVGAGIVLWVGFFIGRQVRELLIPLFDRIKLNSLQEKAGIEVKESARLSNTLAYIVYVLILVTVIITALQVLNIAAISEPAVRMLNIIFEFVPSILAAVAILVVGVLLATFLGGIAESLIASAGLDSKLSKLVDTKSFVLSKIVGIAVKVVVIIFFVVESVRVLQLQVLTDVGSAVIAYMPYVLAAVLILAVCYLAAAAAEKALRKSGAVALTVLVKFAIYGVGAFMVLNQLKIAPELVNAAFILIVAALAVAFAIAFGVGGRDFANRTLKRFEDKYIADKKDEK